MIEDLNDLIIDFLPIIILILSIVIIIDFDNLIRFILATFFLLLE